MYSRTFIGREAELRELKSAFDACASGEGSLVMVVGEPGIGKTSLCEQLATYAAVRGGRTLVGHCYEEGSLSLPYLPFLEVLRSYVLVCEPEALKRELGSGAGDVARIVSEVRERLQVKETTPTDPEEERFRLLQAVTTFLRNASAAQPLCIVLEDLHDADRGTLDMLSYLARNLAGSRLLIVATYRDVEVDRTHPLAGALVDLRRAVQYQRLLLRGLNTDEVRRMLSGIAGQEIVWSLAEAVFRQTEGNPLFVQEVTRFLAEEGLVKREGGQWRSTTEELALSIPEGLRDVIGKRLSRLSAECNQLLATAAVIGREFALETLRRISPLPEEQLIAALEEAVKVGVLEDRSRGREIRYRFAHAFFRQSLYEELIAPRRIRLHHAVAGALEEQYAGRLDEHAAELAEHFSYSSDAADLEKSVRYSEMAAERASAVFAHSEAAAYYQRAIEVQEVLDPADYKKRAALLLAQAVRYRRAAAIDSARAAMFEAAQIAQANGDKELLALSADVGSMMFWIAGLADPAMRELIESALDGGGPSDEAVKSRLMSRLALLLNTQRETGGRELADEALALARALDDARTLYTALTARIFWLLGPADVREREAVVEEMAQLAHATGDPEMHESVTLMRAGSAFLRGDLKLARRWVREHRDLTERYRLGAGADTQQMWRFEFACLDGNFAEAERLLDELDEVSDIRWREFELVRKGASPPRARLMAKIGRLDEVIDDYEERSHRLGEWWYHQVSSVHLYGYSGRLDRCRAAMDDVMAAGLAEMASTDSQWAMIGACLATACVALDDAAVAEELYPLLLPYSGYCLNMRTRTPSMFGPADMFLGSLACLLGRFDDAERHFEAALKFTKAMPSPPMIAEVECAFAAMLLKRDRKGDRARALALLAEGGETARKLGMKPMAERAVMLKGEAQRLPSDIRTSIDAVAASIEAEHPDLQSHAAPDGTVTIMFSDIEGSTEITERLGDKGWMKLLREHNAIVRKQIKAHGGFEVKSEGDGFMVAFQSARKAVECAIGIQDSLRRRNGDASEPVLIRIGLHSGEAIKEGSDFYGRNVIIAARVASQASGGEVLVSSILKTLVESSGDIAWGAPRQASLKGLRGKHVLWPVEWQA